MTEWIVEFSCPEGRSEAVLREGTREEVMEPDDLGCLPVAVYPSEDVAEVLSVLERNGTMRVQAKLKDGRTVG